MTNTEQQQKTSKERDEDNLASKTKQKQEKASTFNYFYKSDFFETDNLGDPKDPLTYRQENVKNKGNQTKNTPS